MDLNIELMLDELGKYSNGITLVNTFGYLGVSSLQKDKHSTDRVVRGVSGVVGYRLRNDLTHSIPYLTEEVFYDKEQDKYVGKVVEKELLPNQCVDLTKVYTTHLLKRPEFNGNCSNAILIANKSNEVNKLTKEVQSIIMFIQQNENSTDEEVQEKIAKLRVKLKDLGNKLVGTYYLRCKNKGESVHDDHLKIDISRLNPDGTYGVKDEFIGTFGLLNNTVTKPTSKKINEGASLLNQVDKVVNGIDENLINKIRARADK